MLIWKKLMASYLVILFFLLMIAGVSIYSLSLLYDKTNVLVQEVIPLSEDVNRPEINILNLENAVMQFIMNQNESYLANWEKEKKELAVAFKASEHFYQKYPQIKTMMQKQKDLANRMVRFYEDQIELVIGFDVVSAQMNIVESNKLMDEYRKTKEETRNVINQINKDSLKSASEIKSKILIFSMVISLIVLIIILLIAYRIIKGISTPIKMVSATLGQISNGDLMIEEITTTRRDELGDMIRSLNKMTKDLRLTVTKVSESALQVASQSEQLTVSAEQGSESAKVSSQIARDTVESFRLQEQEIQKISQSIRKMSTSIKDISDSSNEMILVMEKATKHTSEGSMAVKNVTVQMRDISQTVEDTTVIMQNLGEKSKEIDRIVNMITSISEQTNLLALNAAIEAARAGVHGHGFTVVADEVRKLAIESKKSAAEISDMITDTQGKMIQAVQAMENSKKKINHGLKNTTDADYALVNLEDSISNTYEKGKFVRTAIMQVETISLNMVNSVEQVQEMVSSSVANLQYSSEASEEQLASIEEVSNSTYHLASLAEELEQLINHFKFGPFTNSNEQGEMDILLPFSNIEVASTEMKR